MHGIIKKRIRKFFYNILRVMVDLNIGLVIEGKENASLLLYTDNMVFL